MEAGAHGIEPIIFSLPGREHDGFEQGRQIRERFNCPLVVVDNASLGEPAPFTCRSPGYHVMSRHPLRLAFPRLDGSVTRLLDDPHFSISEYLHRPGGEMPPAKGAGLRDWLLKIFREVWRLHKTLENATAARRPPESRSA